MMRSKTPSPYLAGICLLVSMLVCAPLLAQQNDQKALARAQYMLRQVNAEKVSLQQQLQALQKEYQDYQAEADDKLSQAARREQKLKGTLAKWKQSHGNIQGSLRDRLGELAREKQRSAQLARNLTMQTENFDVCHSNNEALTQINNELVVLYDEKGFMSLVRKGEPLTGIAKVKVENLVQDYKYRIEDLDLQASAHLLKPVEQLPVQAVPASRGSEPQQRAVSGAAAQDAPVLESAQGTE